MSKAREDDLRPITPYGFGEGRPKSGPGLAVGRVVAGLLQAKRRGFSGAEAAAWVERVFRDKGAAGVVSRALNTTGVATGGALIPQAFAAEVIELLRAETVIRRAGPTFVDLTGGNLTIPRMMGGATAAYQGELDDIPATQESFDDLQLNAKKLTAMVPVSNDLLRRSPIDMDATLRDDLVKTIARKEDLQFLLGDGSNGGPVGLLNRCSPAGFVIVQPFPAFDNGTVVTFAVGALNAIKLTMKNAMSRMLRPVWIGVPATFAFLASLRDDMGGFLLREELNRGELLGCPWFQSQQIPSNLSVAVAAATGTTAFVGSYLFLVDMADILLGDAYSLEIDTSMEASFKDAAGNSVSAFTRDTTLYRAICEHDLAVRHQASIVIATLPGWAPPGFGSNGPGAAFYVQAPSGDGSAAASVWGVPPSGSNLPGNIAAAAPGGQMPGRA